MSKKKLRYLGLALSFVVLAAACATEDDGEDDLLAEVMERGTLRVALEAIYEPDSFLDESGNIIGFNPDVAEEIAERLGLDGVEYTEPSFSVIVAANWQNRWDVAIHGITITEERLEILLYTQPYQYSDPCLPFMLITRPSTTRRLTLMERRSASVQDAPKNATSERT